MIPSLDPLRPYIALIRIVLCIAAGGALFVGGCSQGYLHAYRSAQSQVIDAKRRADKIGVAASECAQSLAAVNRETLAAKQRADEWQRAADAADARAAKSADAANAKIKAADKALQAAKAVAACRNQLEVELCPDIPLL